MDRVIELKIERDCLLRDFLRNRFSGRRIHFLREKGHILLNGQPASVTAHAKAGDAVRLVFSEQLTFDYPPQDMGLREIYSDEDVLVVYKPSGVASMPVAPHFSANLLNGIKFLYPQGVFRVVTRLDRNTSGLVLLAKNALSHSILHENIRLIKKTYTAVCVGELIAPVTVDAPIISDGGAKRRVGEGGKPSKTHVIASKPHPSGSLVTVVTETGRTHQIRVHLAFIGHPLCGDLLYGSPSLGSNGAGGHLLCCSGVEFIHPITGKNMKFSIDGEADLASREGF